MFSDIKLHIHNQILTFQIFSHISTTISYIWHLICHDIWPLTYACLEFPTLQMNWTISKQMVLHRSLQGHVYCMYINTDLFQITCHSSQVPINMKLSIGSLWILLQISFKNQFCKWCFVNVQVYLTIHFLSTLFLRCLYENSEMIKTEFGIFTFFFNLLQSCLLILLTGYSHIYCVLSPYCSHVYCVLLTG